MAEAVVEDRPQQQRFYCHLCSVEVQSVNTDFTCPLCSGGFIEELPAVAEPMNEENFDATSAQTMDDLDMLRDEIATLLMSRGANLPQSDPQDGSEDDGTGLGRIRGRNAAGPRRIRLRNMGNLGRFDSVLLEILQTLSGGNEGALGNASMFFMGNPGDYAWGREGIDTIVTQLLNQMDTTGPPPLSKDKIAEIPNVDITQEQVDHKLQCSVCWEDFKFSESVRKLPCLHVYHENCIVPWLELHGTCPICRKSLMPEGQENADSLHNSFHARYYPRFSGDDQAGLNVNNTAPVHSRYQNDQSSDNANNASDMINNTVSSQDGSHPTNSVVNMLSSIPLSLSRLFSQPGTSSQFPQFGFSTPPQGSELPQQDHPQQQNQPRQQEQLSDSGGGDREGDNESGRRNNRSSEPRRFFLNQPDNFRFDDGNVEFEFD